MICEVDGCGETEGVQLEPSRTAYHWDGKGEDPNRPVALCRPCAEAHHEHWDEMWRMVNDDIAEGIADWDRDRW